MSGLDAATPVHRPDALDLAGPLPHGLSVIEASAGTGKTFTLTALAARALIVDGLRSDELMVVTFTRAAAAELRARIRAGVREALDVLRAHGQGRSHPSSDVEWLRALVPEDPDEALHLAQVAARAVSTLDRATITTIHGFCQASLAQLGLRGTGSERRMNPDTDRLRRDIVRDRLLAELMDDPHALSFIKRVGKKDVPETPGQVERRIAQVVRRAMSSAAVVLPAGRSDHAVADANASLATSIIGAIRRRLDGDGELSFDELILRMHETLHDPVSGAVAVRQLRSRTRLAMVDEMQDTDVLQWGVIQRAFLEEGATLGRPADVVIVGDPKQSIYRFRGADVEAYLEAARSAGERVFALDVNWRSSAPLLDALDTLMDGASFGSTDIAFRSVAPRPDAEPTLADAGEPLEVRWLPFASGVALTTHGLPVADAARDVIRADLCARVVELLGTARIGTHSDWWRWLRPGDIAVLVRSNREAATLVELLNASGVPAVQPKGGDVFATEAFREWRVLLSALAAPVDLDRVRALALSWFVSDGLAVIDDEARLWRLQERCGAWRDRVASVGVLPLLAELRADEEVAVALARAGERGITDLEHLAELAHVACGARGVPAAVVLRALEDLSLAHDREEDDGDDPAVRRIDSDGDAVQVMTFHRAKGLEFPVVLLPDSFGQVTNAKPWTFRSGGRRVLDAASGERWSPHPDGASHPNEEAAHPHATMSSREESSKDEILGDAARLLYVALTRAREKLVVWWAPTQGTDSAKLTELLLVQRGADGRREPGATAPPAKGLTDAMVADALGGLAARGGISIVPLAGEVERVHHRRAASDDGEPLSVAPLDRRLAEPDVWRWSFTGLLRGADPVAIDAPATGPVVPARPDDVRDELDLPGPRGGDDEPMTPSGLDGAGLDEGSGAHEDAVGELIGLPGGTGFGVLVHEVLEAVDLAAEDVEDLLRHEVATRVSREGLTLDAARLARGLVAALRTPLDPIAPGLTLSGIAPQDRVHELAFDLPLDDTHRGVDLAVLAGRVAAELDADDPYRASIATLPERIDRRRIAGWLTGVVDLAVRLPDGRHLVADYKTNRLPGDGGRPSYDGATMRAAMVHGEYPLQALLYLVGLHRILALRLAGYDPDVHLGGSAFLFLRGMIGPDTPLREGVRDGVSLWRPPTTAVLAADAVLRGVR